MKRDLRIDLSTGKSLTARVLVLDDGALTPAERDELDAAVTRAGVTWCGPCRGLEIGPFQDSAADPLGIKLVYPVEVAKNEEPAE